MSRKPHIRFVSDSWGAPGWVCVYRDKPYLASGMGPTPTDAFDNWKAGLASYKRINRATWSTETSERLQ